VEKMDEKLPFLVLFMKTGVSLTAKEELVKKK